MSYSTFTVRVDGGDLTVGRWAAQDDDAPVVLALHGITAHHLAWPHVAEALDLHVIAPDLRGRGRSRDVAGAGLVTHADDAATVARSVVGADGQVIVVGHSMGAFVAMVLADRYPELVAGVVLVDGGFPFAEQEKETTVGALEAIKARLEARLPSEEAYVDLFRSHPAFAGDADAVVEEYARYDVVEQDGEFHAGAVLESVLADQRDVLGSAPFFGALESLRALPAGRGGRNSRHWVFLRAPRGFVDDPPGLYAASTAAELAERYKAVEFREVDDVNHYTIVMSEHGAAAVARAVRDVSPRRWSAASG
ncbi:MAG: alpha/beta fold hydrolase [Mobilicoccus sp.]|nr:alpha/beta fold hydrolase [Mobilicoccus sp.]